MRHILGSLGPKMFLTPKVDDLLVKLLDPTAELPKRGSMEAAGYDIKAVESSCIDPGKRGVVKTGLAIATPQGTYARIAPRSGLALRAGIDVLAGVIDHDYRGELAVILQNNGDEVSPVNQGDRVAQIILEKIANPEVVEVDKLEETTRADYGLGSTGAPASEEKHRTIIEFCCGENSNIGQHAGRDCQVHRYTVRQDLRISKNLKDLKNVVSNCSHPNNLMLWAAIPCTGGSQWAQLNIKKRVGLERLVKHWRDFRRLWGQLCGGSRIGHFSWRNSCY